MASPSLRSLLSLFAFFTLLQLTAALPYAHRRRACHRKGHASLKSHADYGYASSHGVSTHLDGSYTRSPYFDAPHGLESANAAEPYVLAASTKSSVAIELSSVRSYSRVSASRSQDATTNAATTIHGAFPTDTISSSMSSVSISWSRASHSSHAIGASSSKTWSSSVASANFASSSSGGPLSSSALSIASTTTSAAPELSTSTTWKSASSNAASLSSSVSREQPSEISTSTSASSSSLLSWSSTTIISSSIEVSSSTFHTSSSLTPLTSEISSSSTSLASATFSTSSTESRFSASSSSSTILSASITSAFSSSVPASKPTGCGHIPNPSFEHAFEEGWKIEGWGQRDNPPTLSTADDPDGSLRGSRLVEIYFPTLNMFYWSTTASDLIVGRTYRISYWVKVSKQGSSAVTVNEAAGPLGGGFEVLSKLNEWYTVGRSFSATSTSMKIKMTSYASTGDMTFSYDDFRIYSDDAPAECYVTASEPSIVSSASPSSSFTTSTASSALPSPTGCGLIRNPSFEEGLTGPWSRENNPQALMFEVSQLLAKDTIHGPNVLVLALYGPTSFSWGTTLRDLAIGRTYSLSFWVMTNTDGLTAISIDGQIIGGSQSWHSIDIAGENDRGWQRVVRSFVATAKESEMLVLTDTMSTAGMHAGSVAGFMYDDFRVWSEAAESHCYADGYMPVGPGTT